MFDFGQNPPIILGVVALFQLNFCLENCFLTSSFENIYVLDSCLIRRYIIIEYRSILIFGKIDKLLWGLWPFFNLFFASKMVSFSYLLKKNLYWI